VILTDERLTYDDVNSILKGNSGAVNKSEGTNFVETLKNMDQLAKKLKEKRNRRGALDFNLPEAKVKLDSRGKPVEITVRVSEGAESMIEEFMLLCNEVIATHLYKRQHPCIYRVHERPEEKKLYALRDFLTLFDIKMEGNLGRVSPRQFQKIMDTVKNTPVERIVNYVLLRSLPQAWYSVSPLGHFGLALRYYAHFTAPIRRYPDLLVHRVLHSTLKKPRTAEDSRKLVARLSQLAFHSSEQERVAMEAERECLDLKKVEFMEDKVGNEYSGIISGVTSFGFFVELENTIEGLVHVTSLQDDYYTFNEKRYELVGERSRKVYRLGDSVKVLLEKVSRETRTIYFTPNP
jgi:ribonuclease R